MFLRPLPRLGRLFMLLAMLSGGVLSIRENAIRRDLLREYVRLRSLTGELSVTDPGKIQVVALETDDPMEFLWRVYLPPEETYRWHTKTSFGGSGYSTSAHGKGDPSQSLVRLRLRVRDGTFEKFFLRPGGSSFSTFGDPLVAEQFRHSGSQLVVNQLGSKAPAVLARDQVATLLELNFSDAFRREVLQRREDQRFRRVLEKPLLLVQFGTERGFTLVEGQSAGGNEGEAAP